MNAATKALRWWTGLLVALLSLGLAQAAPAEAQDSPAACSDGYALWANSRSRADTLMLSGSGSTVFGGARSNAELRISGSNNRIENKPIYTTTFLDGGDSNSYPAPQRAAAAAPPATYRIADYRPGGASARAAAAAGRYTRVDGDLDIAEPTTLDGLYYVTGNAKLSASNLRGTATIVAEGMIDVSGSGQRLSPYADGLLLLSGRAEPGAAVIKLAGDNNIHRGVISGLGGAVELSGSANRVTGLVIGDTLSLPGSALQIRFAPEHCPGGPGQAPQGDPYVPGQLVIKLFSPADLAAVAQANGLDPAPLGQFGSRPIYLVRIADGTDPLLKAEQIRPAGGSGGDSRVQYAEPNFYAQTPEARRGRTSWVIGQGSGGYAGQWAPATIRLAQAHTISRGEGVTVAVLDTGVDLDHPALAGKLVAGFDFVDFDDDPREEGGRADPSFGHGTHVAGLVALAAPAAKIMPVRVLDKEGAGNIWVLAEGLIFAAEIGPDGRRRSGDEAAVINLSLSTTRQTRLLEDIVGELTCASDDDDDDERCQASGGVVVIAAAGNEGNTVAQYPAAEAVAGSLALGASTPADTRASFSTYGSWVPLAAPGQEIVSTVPGGGYGTWSGTSMAAPLAAGTAALVRATYPELTAAEVTEHLVETGKPIDGLISRRLDAARALGIPLANNLACAGPCKVFMPLVIGR